VATVDSPSAETVDPASYHPPRPGSLLQAVRIGDGTDQAGSLAVFRRTPLTPTERSLLEALAGQVYVKLRHSRVFARSVEREEELARIISSSSDGIFVIGEDGRIRSWSPAMERITGVPDGSAVGKALWDVLEAPQGEDEVWRRFGDPAYLHTDGIETAAFVGKDGTIGWIRFSRNALRSHEGAPSGVVVVARDESADIKAEQAKGNFIASISHELRTPLTPLKGYLSLLAAGRMALDREETQESFEVMLRHTGRLERLINDLLDASQMETGRPTIQLERVELVDLLAAVIADYERDDGAKVLFEPHCARAQVMADPFRVQQVLANLISNARKYSPPESPVRVAAVLEGRVCVVSVTDQGEGIPAAEQDRIFDRFYRVDNSATQSTGGVGLGLYIARQLVESMAGRMRVTSEPGDGSTFSFSLPLAADGPSDAARS
jgi:PAS domain S-box-containing protein